MEGIRLDNFDFKEITSGYRERMRRLALFEPLLELDRKQRQDDIGTSIDMKGLGLLALLFFFEQKLIRQYRTDVKHLATFLRIMTEQHYVLEESDYERIARLIVQTFRPTTGKKRSYSFFNWETNKDEAIEYSILRANDFDVKTNTQFYTLDEDGLELLFATKEFYSEFQLSINQLLLRKQIDKGEFQGALRQINEMRIDVETLEERMDRLKHEIQRSIVSEETFERYKQLLNDIYERFAREDEEFKELRTFVKETRERLFSKDIHLKEKKTYDKVLRIIRELETVHSEHSKLLQKTAELQNTTLVIAQESLYYTGMQSFNFDQDIVSTIISSPLNVDVMKGVLHPFLKIEENLSWSPFTVFTEQNITEEREEKELASFEEIEKSENEQVYRKWLSSRYKELMEKLLEAYEQGQAEKLSRFANYVIEQENEQLLEQRYFYDFFLLLHQQSPVTNREVGEESAVLLGEVLKVLGNRKLTIVEGEEILQYCPRYSIQEMQVALEEV